MKNRQRFITLHKELNKKPLRVMRRGFFYLLKLTSVSVHQDRVSVRGRQHLVLHLQDVRKQQLLL